MCSAAVCLALCVPIVTGGSVTFSAAEGNKRLLVVALLLLFTCCGNLPLWCDPDRAALPGEGRVKVHSVQQHCPGWGPYCPLPGKRVVCALFVPGGTS